MGEGGNQFVLVGLGEVLWDLLPSGRQLGGAPTNFAYHACALGGRGVVVSCVGDDEQGRDILQRFEAMGLETGAIATDTNHPTGTVTVEVSDQGQPDFTIHENVAWDYIPAGAGILGLAGRADLVCFGSLGQRCETSRRTIQQFLAATRPGCLRFFDVNLRQHFFTRDVIARSLELSDVLKLNDEELPVVAELLSIPGEQDEVLTELLRRFSLRLVVLTRGADGSVIRSADQESVCGGKKIEVADTVGAGDAFTATVAVGLLRGVDLETIHLHAQRVAGFVCTQPGGTPDMPAELRDFSKSSES